MNEYDRALPVEGMTAGDLYDPALVVTTLEEASKYFQKLVDRRMTETASLTNSEAAYIELQNIKSYAFMAGAEVFDRMAPLYELEAVSGPKPSQAETERLSASARRKLAVARHFV